MTSQLTEEERMQWESEKYSTRLASVFLLSSGRVVVARGLEIAFVCGNLDGLAFAIREIAATPFAEYVPPTQRALPLPIQLDLEGEEFELKI